ncbi:MAG: hypothetical protein RLZ56_218 [Bacteroidota bacterium]
MKPARICISPLDWGLGHATRCIPIVNAFQSLGYEIFIATCGPQEIILRQAFPGAQFLPLRGYSIRYSKKAWLLFFTLLLQIPKIGYAVLYEWLWLKKAQKKYQFDLIVSDNRFGFFHKNTPSVFITHQLRLQTPFNYTSNLYQRILYRCLKNYQACWIPDMQAAPGFSGNLAHPIQMPRIPYWYMGLLSRLYPFAKPIVADDQNEIEFLAIVSGPEPQRSIFEKQLWDQGNALGKKFVLVAGLPENSTNTKQSNCGKWFHHLSGAELVEQIQNAKYIICRGGYTSLMELAGFEKKLILVPTPGQTEQIYLAKIWVENNWAIQVDAKELNVQAALAKASQSVYKTVPAIPFSTSALAAALKPLTL